MDALAGGEDGWVDGLGRVAALLRVLNQGVGVWGVGAEEVVVDLVAEFGGEEEEDGLFLGGCGEPF